MWANPLIIALLRSSMHRVLSASTLLFTLRGRKTGRSITLPANYTRLDERTLLSTSFGHRTWWRNLRGGADVTVRVAGRDHSARATAIEAPDAVAEGLHGLLCRRPGWAKRYGVSLDASGAPIRSDCERIVRERNLVLIRSTLAI